MPAALAVVRGLWVAARFAAFFIRARTFMRGGIREDSFRAQ